MIAKLTALHNRLTQTALTHKNTILIALLTCSLLSKELLTKKVVKTLFIAKYLPKWEKTTGLYCSSWQSQYMTTKWGTCNPTSKKIWLNIQLAKKPIECLEYVILHELAHLKVHNHGPEFTAILDQYMPCWRDHRCRLNDSTLDYLPSQHE